MASTPGFEPGPHWWEASALTTAPSLAPHFSRLYKNNMFNTPPLQTDSSAAVEVCVCHQTELLEHEPVHPETIKEINVDESPLRLH